MSSVNNLFNNLLNQIVKCDELKLKEKTEKLSLVTQRIRNLFENSEIRSLIENSENQIELEEKLFYEAHQKLKQLELEETNHVEEHLSSSKEDFITQCLEDLVFIRNQIQRKNLDSLSSDTFSSKDFTAIYVENRGKETQFPENCKGAIGVTIDDNVSGFSHMGLKLFNTISTNINDTSTEYKIAGKKVDLTHVMHAFVTTERKSPNCLKVCEAVGQGVLNAKIKGGDTDWTSMILFVPKNQELVETIVNNAKLEATPDQENKVASYEFIGGITSVFVKKHPIHSYTPTEILSQEIADFIKKRSIRDADNSPKAAICSQLALRILRASMLMQELREEKIRKYEQLDVKVISQRIAAKLEKKDHFLAQKYHSSDLFHIKGNEETLPYELLTALLKESDMARDI